MTLGFITLVMTNKTLRLLEIDANIHFCDFFLKDPLLRLE